MVVTAAALGILEDLEFVDGAGGDGLVERVDGDAVDGFVVRVLGERLQLVGEDDDILVVAADYDAGAVEGHVDASDDVLGQFFFHFYFQFVG